MKDYQNKGKPTSTRAILPEEKQGMSLNNLDFVSISLQEIDEIPQSVDMPAVQPMPNIISPRKQTGEKGKSKANPNAAAVADKVLKKWGIDRKTAQELMNAHLPLSDIKLSPTVQKGRQSSAKKVDKPLKIDKTEKIEKVKKLENTSKTPSENILKETYQASYEPITPKTQPEKPKKSSKNNKKEKNKAKNKAKGSANLAKESLQWAVENSPAKQQRRISADIQSADKAVAKLFRSQRKMPPLQPMADDELPLVEQPYHTISADELQAALLPEQSKPHHKPLKAVKLPKPKTKIKLPERKNKASAVQAVEALRWAVEHNPDKPQRTPKSSADELNAMEDNKKPFVKQTHHPISAEELQEIELKEKK